MTWRSVEFKFFDPPSFVLICTNRNCHWFTWDNFFRYHPRDDYTLNLLWLMNIFVHPQTIYISTDSSLEFFWYRRIHPHHWFLGSEKCKNTLGYLSLFSYCFSIYWGPQKFRKMGNLYLCQFFTQNKSKGCFVILKLCRKCPWNQIL